MGPVAGWPEGAGCMFKMLEECPKYALRYTVTTHPPHTQHMCTGGKGAGGDREDPQGHLIGPASPAELPDDAVSGAVRSGGCQPGHGPQWATCTERLCS